MVVTEMFIGTTNKIQYKIHQVEQLEALYTSVTRSKAESNLNNSQPINSQLEMCWSQKINYLKCNHTVKDKGCDGTRPWPSPNRCQYPRILTPTTVDSHCDSCASTQSSKTQYEKEPPSYQQVITENQLPVYSRVAMIPPNPEQQSI